MGRKRQFNKSILIIGSLVAIIILFAAGRMGQGRASKATQTQMEAAADDQNLVESIRKSHPQTIYSVESMAAWTEGTGYVPPRKDVADAENGLKDFLAENAMMNAAIEQMDGVVSWTAFPGDAGLQAEQLLLDMRDQILGGSAAAQDAMTKTQDQINELLNAQ